jgi:lysophospholipase L1-like esterase
MKTILAYGDSLTWGSDPARSGARHPAAHRWPEVLARGLGAGFSVIAEGLRGRTTAYDKHGADCDRNGARLLPTVLYTHASLDLVILALGTNDLKPAIAGPAAAAMLGMRRCIEIAQRHAHRVSGAAPVKVLVVSPPHVIGTSDPFFSDLFAGAISESAKLAGFYAALAKEFDCGFFDAATIAEPEPIDGVHLNAGQTATIGQALVSVVREMLAD